MSDRKVEIHKKVATLGSRSGAERLRLIGEVLSVLLASVQELADVEKQLPREHQRGIWQPLKLDDETHRQELNAMTYRTLETLHDRGCWSGACAALRRESVHREHRPDDDAPPHR